MTSLDKESAMKRGTETLQAEYVALKNVQKIIDDTFFRAVSLLHRRKGKILVTGVGKSGFIGMKMAATLVSLGHEAVFLNPLDALHGDSGIMRDGDVLILFSFSGASPELLKLIRHCDEHFNIKTVLVTGKKDSPLSKVSNEALVFTISTEGCPINLAPMASTTVSLAIADAIASALTSPTVFNREHFARYHPAGSLGLSLKKVKEVMREGKKIPSISSSAYFEDALRVITTQKLVQIVGVVDREGRLIGAFGDGDIRRMLLKYGDLRGKPINLIMNIKPRSIDAEDSLEQALRIMREMKINNLFVTDSRNMYVGFIHIHDIVGE